MIPLLILCFIATSIAFPAPAHKPHHMTSVDRQGGRNVEQLDNAAAAKYLGEFGYISKTRMKNNEISGLIDLKSFKKGIREFQRMAGIRATGKLNKETLKMMSMPRCGVEDTMGAFMMGSDVNIADSKFLNNDERRRAKRMKMMRKSRSHGRSKRYNLQGGMWEKSLLKYHILNYTPDMTKAQVKTAIKNAFNVWANYSSLRFTYTNNPNEADIKISFSRRTHDDSYPFDGQGGTLAHAFFPSDGRAHFDEDEKFTFNSDKGVDLFTVAAHEFGHILGLAHSSVYDSLMAPFYQGYNPTFTLHQDDIAGIQQLYGKKMIDATKAPPVPSTTLRSTVSEPTKKPRKDAMKICGKQISFDSMHFDHRADVLYAFKGTYYWKINDEGVVSGYPKRINRYWKGLPGNINAAVYSKTTRRTYFFKGSRVWRYDPNRRLEEGFPQQASALGLPSNPDAAMQWGRDGKIYVFKNNHFYQFSEYQRYDGVQRYPRKEVSKYWEGVPSDIDGAIQWKNGRTYFFKGDDYWRFSGMGTPMDAHYPKSVKKYWIGCNQKTNPSERLRNSRAHGHSRSGIRRPNKPRRGPLLDRLVLPPVQPNQ